jgi:hypothetical protein
LKYFNYSSLIELIGLILTLKANVSNHFSIIKYARGNPIKAAIITSQANSLLIEKTNPLKEAP